MDTQPVVFANDSELQEAVAEQSIHSGSAQQLDLGLLREKLKKRPFLRITGICNESEILRGRRRMEELFDPARDAPTTGELPDAVMGNFQKLSIGCARHGGVDRPRFKRVFYNPLFAEDIYGLHESFSRLAQVRNRLAGWDLNFAMPHPENGLWTAARIHHFPAGGGFMVAHRDTVLPAVLRDSGLGDFFQPVLVMSQFGEDFNSGGAFIDDGGRRYLYEKFCRPGDIVVYDGRTVHGVEDIDPRQPYRQTELKGRFSGLVTLYQLRVKYGD